MKREQFSGCSIPYHDCRCFDKLTDEEQQLIESSSVKIHYRKGELICKQGSFASHIIYMEKGLAKVFINNGVNSLVLKIIPEKNLLGLTSINPDNRTYQYSAVAYVDCDVKQIEIGLFRQLVERNPAFAIEVIDILSANSIQINGRFFCLTHKQSYGRLADILLCLADRIFKTHDFELPISRKDLAELSGLSPETVVRMLKKFSEEGLISLDGKQFRILDYDRLQKISENG